MDKPEAKPLMTAAEIAGSPRMRLRHPWNDRSEVYVTPLSMMAGLSRTVLSLARVPPGKESFVYHSHERDEEFLYILSGRGIAEIADRKVEVGPGDFMGFTAPGAAHHLTNPFDEDLVYLMGGERSGMDVGHFPRLGRRMLFSAASGITIMEDAGVTDTSFQEWFAGMATPVPPEGGAGD